VQRSCIHCGACISIAARAAPLGAGNRTGRPLSLRERYLAWSPVSLSPRTTSGRLPARNWLPPRRRIRGKAGAPPPRRVPSRAAVPAVVQRRGEAPGDSSRGYTVVEHKAMAVHRSRRRLVGADGDALEARHAEAQDGACSRSRTSPAPREALQGVKPQEVQSLVTPEERHAMQRDVITRWIDESEKGDAPLRVSDSSRRSTCDAGGAQRRDRRPAVATAVDLARGPWLGAV
jgi:hypothetical protein